MHIASTNINTISQTRTGETCLTMIALVCLSQPPGSISSTFHLQIKKSSTLIPTSKLAVMTEVKDKSTSSSTTGLVGWVPESTGRGTLDLITSCAFTIFLCTWLVIHPRVHGQRSLSTLHKTFMCLKAVVAPELIAVEGLQEWNQARNMVKDCAAITQGRLKLIHAFYIGMLALRYRTAKGNKVLWPNQFSWLLQSNLISWDDHSLWGLDDATIHDKSNADSTVKLVALCQVSWFVAQSIMRAAHHLPLSPLEAMTLSYIPLVAVTYAFWWVKPKDVLTASLVKLPHMLPEEQAMLESMAVSNIFDHEGIGPQGSWRIIWELTPRVFEKEAMDHEAEAIEQGGIRIPPVQQSDACILGKKSFDLPAMSTSKEKVVSHWDPQLYRSKLWPAICLFGISFPALHLISWNTVFPTMVEDYLWRSAAFTSIVTMLVFMHFEKVVLRWDGPLTIISLLSPVLYLISRIVTIAGAFAALRASESAIYDTYNVSNYWIRLLG